MDKCCSRSSTKYFVWYECRNCKHRWTKEQVRQPSEDKCERCGVTSEPVNQVCKRGN